jgi:hypothetical protein
MIIIFFVFWGESNAESKRPKANSLVAMSCGLVNQIKDPANEESRRNHYCRGFKGIPET